MDRLTDVPEIGVVLVGGRDRVQSVGNSALFGLQWSKWALRTMAIQNRSPKL